jgi:hypothetical protein
MRYGGCTLVRQHFSLVHLEDGNRCLRSTCDEVGGLVLDACEVTAEPLGTEDCVFRHAPSKQLLVAKPWTNVCRRSHVDKGCHTSYAAVDVVCVRNALGGEAQPNVREP